MSDTIENLVIIGTGPAGLTAAIYAARANLNPLLVEGNQPGGQLTTTTEIENFPGFPAGIDGFQLMQQFREQAERFGARFETDAVASVDFSTTPRKINTTSKTILAKSVIIATGAAPRLIGVPGEKELFGGKGVSTCATCDGAFYRNMEVAIIGGGDSACEEALFLTRFASKVHLVHRRDTLRASKIMAACATSHPKIQLHWNSIPLAIDDPAQNTVTALRLKNTLTGDTTSIPVKGVFIAIGHTPNTAPFAQFLDTDPDGYFVPQPNSQVLTKLPGIYVAGDCADHHYRQAITASGMGCQAAIEAERWLAAN